MLSICAKFRFSCGGICQSFYCKFAAKYANEKIWKIFHRFAKIKLTVSSVFD